MCLSVLRPHTDYIHEGPLLELCKISLEKGTKQAEQWQELASVVAKDLGLTLESLSESERYSNLLMVSILM
jgi:hypothetical protein